VRAILGFRVALSDIRELTLEKTPIATGKRIFGNDAFGLFREGDYEVDAWASPASSSRSPTCPT